MKKQVLIWWLLALTACGTADRVEDSRSDRPMEGEGTEPGDMAGMAMSGTPIRVSQQQAALAGVTFAVAREAPLERTVRAVATVVPNERTQGIVNARVAGWVEKLYANETGMRVARGERLLELYAPDLVTAQEELLLAARLPSTAARDALVAAARRRLRLWEISEDQIAELERTGVVRRTLTIHSAYPGHILEKSVVEGQAVQPGAPLFRIADLSTVWVEPAIFEADISLVRVGQTAEVSFDASPGITFDARITFIYPTLDERTRTLRIRVEVPNPELRIKPGMYGTVRIRAVGPTGVIVPLTAVLPTGERDLVFILGKTGITPTEVTVAERGDSTIVVRQGVEPGDTVVASATFLFDSESSLAAAMKGIMLNMGMGLDMGGMQMDQTMETPQTEAESEAEGKGGGHQ